MSLNCLLSENQEDSFSLNLLLETSDAEEILSGSGAVNHRNQLCAESSQTNTNKTCLLGSNYQLETADFRKSKVLSRSRNVIHCSVDKDHLTRDISLDTEKSDLSNGGTKSQVTGAEAKKESFVPTDLNPLQGGSMRSEIDDSDCEKRYTGSIQGDQVFERDSQDISSPPRHDKKPATMEKKLSIEEIGTESDQEEIEIPNKRYKKMASSQDSDAATDYHLSQKSDSQEIVWLDDKPADDRNKQEYEVAEALCSLKCDNKTEPELIDLTEDEDEEFDDGERNGDNRSQNIFGLKNDTENSETKVDLVNRVSKKSQRKYASERRYQNEESEIIVLDDSQV